MPGCRSQLYWRTSRLFCGLDSHNLIWSAFLVLYMLYASRYRRTVSLTSIITIDYDERPWISQAHLSSFDITFSTPASLILFFGTFYKCVPTIWTSVLYPVGKVVPSAVKSVCPNTLIFLSLTSQVKVALHAGPSAKETKVKLIPRSWAVQYSLTDSGCVFFERGTSAGIL